MLFMLTFCALTFIFATFVMWLLESRESVGYPAAIGLVWTVTFGLIVGGFANAVLRDAMVEEVEVKYPIYPMVGDNYLQHSTEGEYNDPVLLYQARSENGGLKVFSQSAGSAAIKETSGDPYLFMTCPDDSTTADWLLFPWENPEPDCTYEFGTFYVPNTDVD